MKIRSNRRPNAAFTLVELLVVLSIIAMLMALLLPAVQAAREGGRRTQCQNNLKQLGLAIHNHENANRMLPISVGPFNEGPRPWPKRDGRGWILTLLPELEQQRLYDRFAFTSSWARSFPARLPCSHEQFSRFWPST